MKTFGLKKSLGKDCIQQWSFFELSYWIKNETKVGRKP